MIPRERYACQVPALMYGPKALKFRLAFCPRDGKSAFPNFICGLGITAIFTSLLFQTWTVEPCCSVSLFHVLSAHRQFLCIFVIF